MRWLLITLVVMVPPMMILLWSLCRAAALGDEPDDFHLWSDELDDD